MECYPPRPSMEESELFEKFVFKTYINNLYCAINLYLFIGEKEKKKQLNDFNRSVIKILSNKKSLIKGGEYIPPDEKERRLEELCDEIVGILFYRKKNLKMKIKDESDYLLFLDQIFNFFLSKKNLPNFIKLIFSLIIDGDVFTERGDYEKNREWLDSLKFKILSH